MYLIPEEGGGWVEEGRGRDGGDWDGLGGWGGGGPSSSASVPLSSTGARAGTEHAQQGARTGLPATALATQRGGGGWGVREQGRRVNEARGTLVRGDLVLNVRLGEVTLLKIKA